MKSIAILALSACAALGQVRVHTSGQTETVDLVEPKTGQMTTVGGVRVRVTGISRDAQVYRVTLVYDKDGAQGLTMAQRGVARHVIRYDETGLAAWPETAPVSLLFPIGDGATARMVRVETFVGTRTLTQDIELEARR